MNRPGHFISFGALLSLVLCSCHSGIQTRSRAHSLDLSSYALHLVYSNDFSLPQKTVREEDLIAQNPDGIWQRTAQPPADAEWIAEGGGGVEVRDGKLRVAPSPFDEAGSPTPVAPENRSHMVIWNRRVFPADFLLEFEMHPCGSTNGLAIVFFSATGQMGEDLFSLSLPPRRAQYPAYHSGAIANYSDAYWSRNNEAESVSNRLRRNPGFELLREGPSLTTGQTGTTHRIRVLKSGSHLEVEINGQVVCRHEDPGAPLGAGRIGLRSMSGVTTVAYDNFKVWEVAPARSEARRLQP